MTDTVQEGLTDAHDEVRLQDELALRRAVDVGDGSGGRSMDEGRASDVVPHLPGRHGEHEKLSKKKTAPFI